MATINGTELKVYHFYGKDMVEGLYYRKADVDKLIESLKVGDNIGLPDPPKPRRATNRELARWLAQGNGEIASNREGDDHTIAGYFYLIGRENKEVRSNIQVRKWSDTEWHEPMVDYLFGE